MNSFRRILVFHTAFIGDVILALPAVQILRSRFPEAFISFVSIPAASELLANHPAVDEIVVYDKRGRDRGAKAVFSLSGRLRREKFDLGIVPHRSLRSAFIVAHAGIPVRIGFSTSAGWFLLTEVVPYRREQHEITRNLDLLRPLGMSPLETELPSLYPSTADSDAVEEFLGTAHVRGGGVRSGRMIAIAPGSVWMTKRWPEEHFTRLVHLLVREGFNVVLVGGLNDVSLCSAIAGSVSGGSVLDASGKLSLLQSAELIRRCSITVSNDSAPMHLAVAMRTPVVGIFGATIPQFGFGPRGESDEVVETNGLPCRPCSIHGGTSCPIKTFECMKRITPEQVLARIHSILRHVHAES